jgi:hypothetical protein
MKTSLILFLALLLAGCAGSRPGASLTAQQARLLALRLANDKALTIYHCQPFHADQLPQFMAGHWVWTEQEGYGHSDLQATVELSADGLKHTVEVRLMDSRDILSRNF